MKQQGQLGSAALMNSRENKVLPPASSHLKVPAGDKQCEVSPCTPSYLLQNAEKQNPHLAQSFRNLVCRNPSRTPNSGSPEPPKACKAPRQVNGISNCFSTDPTCNSQEGANAGRMLKTSRQLNNTLPLAAAATTFDNSCVAARIRPICRYKKRRLVRVSAVSHLSRKLQRPLSLKCRCEQPNSCILCGCKAPVQTLDPETMPRQERVALLDPGFHPILSFSHGKPLRLHFEALLREEHRLNLKLKNPKAFHCGLKDLTNNISSSSFSASDSLLKGPAGRHQTPHQPNSLSPMSSLCLENTPSLHSTAAGNLVLPAKKKKVECCYDINNIVIPVSMAAATRVEKLQYKEIITPSWRLVNPRELKTSEEMDSELEDTSDETYLNHHQKYEQLERSHWDSWAGAANPKRGNSRSANKADGRWAAPPDSPEEALSPSLHDDPGTSSPTGSLSPELPSVLEPLFLKGRGAGGLSVSEDARFSVSDAEDDGETVQPWEPRTFPLCDAEYGALQGPWEALGKQTRAIELWDSGRHQGLRTSRINSGASNPREPLTRRWPAEPDRSKPQKEFVGQPCLLPVLLNHR